MPALPAFPLKLSLNGLYPTDQNNVPFYFSGFAAWSGGYAINRADWIAYLEDRYSKGCNIIILNAMDRVLLAQIPNRDGENPLLTPDDLATPNDDYFDEINWRCLEAAKYGIAVMLTPNYYGFFRNPDIDGWYEVMAANGVTKVRNFSQYLATRITAPNVVWHIGGDSNPDNPAIGEAVGLGIRDVDTTRPITAHTRSTFTAYDVYGAMGFLIFNMVYAVEDQGNLPDRFEDAHGQAIQEIDYREGDYENENSTPKRLRRQMWLQGAWGGKGHVFAVFPVWLFGFDYGTIEPPPDPNWKPYMQSAGSRNMEVFNRYMQAQRWTELVPDYARTVITAGIGSAPEIVTCALTTDRTYMLAPIPSARTVTLDLSEFAAPVDLYIMDPTSGEFTKIDGSPFNNSGTTQIDTGDFGDNREGDDDWILFGHTQGSINMAQTGKRLFGPALLSDTAATKYTVPASTRTKIQGIHLMNPSAAAVSFTISIGNDTAATRIYSGLSISAGQPFDSYGPFYMEEGEILQAFASTTNILTCTIDGLEMST